MLYDSTLNGQSTAVFCVSVSVTEPINPPSNPCLHFWLTDIDIAYYLSCEQERNMRRLTISFLSVLLSVDNVHSSEKQVLDRLIIE